MALTPQQEKIKAALLAGQEVPGVSEDDLKAIAESTVPSEPAAPQMTARPTSLATPIELDSKTAPQMPAYKAALLGGSQGLTAGFADDAAAAVASLPQFAGERTMPSQSAMRSMAANDPAAVDRLLTANAPDAERRALMESQKQTLQDAATQQPIAYYGGQVAGSLPAAMAVGPSAGGQIALGAAQGAGLAPEGQKLNGMMLGGGAGALGAAVSKGAGVLADKLGGGLMDMSDKALNAYLQLPAEDYIRFKNSGQLDEMLAIVRRNLSVTGGRAETARSIALEKEPVGRTIRGILEGVDQGAPAPLEADSFTATQPRPVPKPDIRPVPEKSFAMESPPGAEGLRMTSEPFGGEPYRLGQNQSPVSHDDAAVRAYNDMQQAAYEKAQQDATARWLAGPTHVKDAEGASALAVPSTATSNDDLAALIDQLALEQSTEGTMQGRQTAAPWLSGYADELSGQSKDYEKLSGFPKYKTLPELHDERKALDALSFENGKRPGIPVNPSMGRSIARGAITGKIDEIVGRESPGQLQDLQDFERNYENMSKSQDYLTQAADSIHGTGSAAGDAAAMLSGRGAKAGLSVTNSIYQPIREFAVSGAAKYAKPLGAAMQSPKFQAAVRSLGSVQGPLQMKIQSILEEIANSDNPGLTDYMYREIDPDYNAHMLKAEEEADQQSKER